MEQKNIDIKNAISYEKIYIGRSALKIILSNLIGNAVKYTGLKGDVNIGVENIGSYNAEANDNEDDEIGYERWFYIENTYDSNVEEIDLDKIFDINFNLNKENSSGLGLYIVKNLLDNYNLIYKVENRDGMFVFKIKIEGGE